MPDVEVLDAHGERHVAVEPDRLVPHSKPCRACGCDIRIEAPGWGERCGCCGEHGIDLELDEEDAD